MFGTSAVFLLPCGFRGFFRPKKGRLNRVWYRKSIDKEKSTGYTGTALGKLRNKLEKKNRFMKQEKYNYLCAEGESWKQQLPSEPRKAFEIWGISIGKAEKRTGEAGCLKKTPEGVFFQGLS